MGVIVLQLFNGISISSILLLIALGLAITFGLMKVINMAHGELIMIGAYTRLCRTEYVHLLFPACSYLVCTSCWLFQLASSLLLPSGWFLEMSLIRFLYGRPLDSLLATWGIGLMLQQLARSIFGAQNVGVTSRNG